MPIPLSAKLFYSLFLYCVARLYLCSLETFHGLCEYLIATIELCGGLVCFWTTTKKTLWPINSSALDDNRAISNLHRATAIYNIKKPNVCAWAQTYVCPACERVCVCLYITLLLLYMQISGVLNLSERIYLCAIISFALSFSLALTHTNSHCLCCPFAYIIKGFSPVIAIQSVWLF